MPGPSDKHCGRPGCHCPHAHGCEFGWTENSQGQAVPCKVCRGERQPYPSEDRREWLARLRKAGKGEAA